MSKFSVGEWVIVQSKIAPSRNGERHTVVEVIEPDFMGSIICPVTGNRLRSNGGTNSYHLSWDGVPHTTDDGVHFISHTISEVSLRPIPKDNEAAGEFTTMMDNLLDVQPLTDVQSTDTKQKEKV